MFWVAGGWGIITTASLYFLYDSIGRLTPPPVTHPEFYYGFAGVTMAWQFAFFVIGSAPDRFRPMIIPSVLEKLGYVVMVVVLQAQNRITPSQALASVPDGILGILFTIAFVRTKARDTRH